MGYLMIVALVGGYPFYMPRPPRIQPRFVPPVVRQVPPRIALRPGQKCAIPLLNVLPNHRFYDNMVKRLPPAPRPSPEIVEPPAPSCDDVK